MVIVVNMSLPIMGLQGFRLPACHGASSQSWGSGCQPVMGLPASHGALVASQSWGSGCQPVMGLQVASQLPTAPLRHKVGSVMGLQSLGM